MGLIGQSQEAHLDHLFPCESVSKFMRLIHHIKHTVRYFGDVEKEANTISLRERCNPFTVELNSCYIQILEMSFQGHKKYNIISGNRRHVPKYCPLCWPGRERVQLWS